MSDTQNSSQPCILSLQIGISSQIRTKLATKFARWWSPYRLTYHVVPVVTYVGTLGTQGYLPIRYRFGRVCRVSRSQRYQRQSPDLLGTFHASLGGRRSRRKGEGARVKGPSSCFTLSGKKREKEGARKETRSGHPPHPFHPPYPPKHRRCSHPGWRPTPPSFIQFSPPSRRSPNNKTKNFAQLSLVLFQKATNPPFVDFVNPPQPSR